MEADGELEISRCLKFIDGIKSESVKRHVTLGSIADVALILLWLVGRVRILQERLDEIIEAKNSVDEVVGGEKHEIE